MTMLAAFVIGVARGRSLGAHAPQGQRKNLGHNLEL